MTQFKSILFLTRLYHPHIGGVEKHVQQISNELVKRGKSVTILTEQFDKNLPLFEIKEGIEIYRVPIGGNGFFKKFFIWKWVILKLSLFYKADIIHIHDVFYWIFPIRFLLLFKKIYLTFHGYEGYPIRARWIILRRVSEYLSNGSICVGEFMKKWYFASPRYIFYGAVKLPERNISPKKHTAVFFGRLDSQTGILEYLRAYLIIKKKYPDFRLTIIGEGELVSKIPDDITVLKFTSNIEQYIANNEYIFVSRYLSMLEALVQKRVVIATYDNPVKEDYLKMSPFGNYVYIANTPEEIANIVIDSISQPNKNEKMLSEGYDWATKQTWEKMVNIYFLLWRVK